MQIRFGTLILSDFVLLALAWAGVGCLSGCRREADRRAQGYVEGEYVYVSSARAGRLEQLPVDRGAQVKAGDLLFVLEQEPERSLQDEAERRLARARARLADAEKGKRPSEIASLEAMLGQARADLAFSESEIARQEKLKQRPGASAEQEYDLARFNRDRNLQRMAQLQADLDTAKLGAREDQIAAAQESVRSAEAAWAKAVWDLSQKRRQATQAGLVFDTLYREGEWVPAGRPAVVILPPENIKVRAFVPEELVGALKPGDSVRVIIDAVPEPVSGKISFISPHAEYTPPVIYSRESRSKLAFMIEAVFDRKTAAGLHPGQPVDVEFGG